MFFANYFFSVKTIKSICPQSSIFNFSITKKFLQTNFDFESKFRISFIIFFYKINICDLFYINRFHFNCAMIFIVVFLLTISSNLPIFTFFILKSYIYKFYSFKVLINLSATANVLLLCVEKISIAFFSSHYFIDLL